MARQKNRQHEPEADSKKKNKNSKIDGEKVSASQDKENENTRKPQRGLSLADNFGWTGKLPATLLHEHCQKQKWRKVEFDMKKTSKGFTGIAVLSWENPKTKEIMTVKMMPDYDLYSPKETTNEARHYAATYALFRINYMKSMKMILPTIFRDYWSQLEKNRVELSKVDKNRHDNIYNSDPFSVILNQREKTEEKEKRKQIKEEQERKIAKPQVILTTTNDHKQRASSLQTSEITKRYLKNVPTFPKKVWANAPMFDISPELRIGIEKSIKKHIKWSPSGRSNDDSEATLPFLRSLGFREMHIKEAFLYTSRWTDALEWLIFHVPEDDLPPMFSRSNQDSGVSLRLFKNLEKEYLIERVSNSGYDRDQIEAMIDRYGLDESKITVALSRQLIDFPDIDHETEDAKQIWMEEIECLQSIGSNSLGDFDPQVRSNIVSIQLIPQNIASEALWVKLYRSGNYPNDLPGIQLILQNSSIRLANYVKLSIIRNLLHYLVDNKLLGSCFIFAIIEWLQDNISKICDNPGPLADKRESDKCLSRNHQIKVTKENTVTSGNSFKKLSVDDISESYKKRFLDPGISNLLKGRSALPAWEEREKAVQVINSHRVTLVTGETGSGKSTQIVQFILDHLYAQGNTTTRIFCTQPRRISALGLAERVSDERLDKVGNEVGYIIRGENKTSSLTRVSFLTTGVFLRMLQSLIKSKNKKENMESLEYIFVDEVHERSLESDLLLIILKNFLNSFKNMKIILMSATTNLELYRRFFSIELGHLFIRGRMFPVEDIYLDQILNNLDYTIVTRDERVVRPKADSHYFSQGNINYDLIAKLCDSIDDRLTDEGDGGSLLVFLPGVMEIVQCIRMIENVFEDKGKGVWCLPLHSALPSSEQKRVFRVASKRTRKIVVSTNIAETSITIPDCVAVIDSARCKTMYFDNSLKSTRLIEDWCSYAETKQRRGRAGRIKQGTCYHLYSRETEQSMSLQPIPEILRTRLENLYLIVKTMGISDVLAFLNSGLDPPNQDSIENCKKTLHEMGALVNDSLSSLGKYLSYLPTDLQSGKLLVFGCIFRCLEPCLTIASINSNKSPFLNNFEKRADIKKVQMGFSRGQGDIIASLNVYNEYQNLSTNARHVKTFLDKNFLSHSILKEISSTRLQYLSFLRDIGYVSFKYSMNNSGDGSYVALNRNSNNLLLLRAIITGAFYPHIGHVQFPDRKYISSMAGSVEADPDAKKVKYWVRDNLEDEQNGEQNENMRRLPAKRVFVHPSSSLMDTLPKTSTVVNDDVLDESEAIDFEKARQTVTSLKSNSILSPKDPFVVYSSLHYSNKLYIRDITVSSTLAVLLFGGEIVYDISSSLLSGGISPGIIFDSWLPIRTWCKNGVLVRRLKSLVDELIDSQLSSPSYVAQSPASSDEDVLQVVEQLFKN